MPIELWIIGIAAIVLAVSIWRILAWRSRNPRAVGATERGTLYTRIQIVLLVVTCVILSALLAAVVLWRDVPLWLVIVGILTTVSIAEWGRRMIIARMWRCPSCDRALPTRTRRSGTNPASTAQCPSCGYQLTR